MALVKWDKNGNPISTKGDGEKKNKPKVKWSFMRVIKGDAPAVVGEAGAGVLAVGAAAAIISVVPPLRRWATTGSTATRLAVLTGTSLLTASLGLALYARQAGAKKAMMHAPGVLVSVMVLTLAPFAMSSIVNKIDAWASRLANTTPVTGQLPSSTTPAATGQGPVPQMRARNQRLVINADAIIEAQKQAARRGHQPETINGDLW